MILDYPIPDEWKEQVNLDREAPDNALHNEDLHADCLALLDEYAYPVVAAVRPSESYSMDGIIVAKRRGIGGVERVSVALRNAPKTKIGLDRERP